MEDLESFPRDFQVHVGVITETRPLKSGAKTLHFPGYDVIHGEGRYTHKGGALLLADSRGSGRRLPDAPSPKGDTDACSSLIHPVHTEGEAIRLTGIYIPPSVDADSGMVYAIIAPENRAKGRRGNTLSQLVGDFNHH